MGGSKLRSVLNIEPLCTQIAFSILDAQNLDISILIRCKLRELAVSQLFPKEILIPETFVDKNNVNGYRRKK